MPFQAVVHDRFSAAHAITIRGEREALHGHDWAVRAVVEAPTLDGDGLVCDFHALEHALREVIAPFRNANLNDTPPFDRVNPTAEHVAGHIGDALLARLGRVFGDREFCLRSVSVTEAPGCKAVYKPDPARAGR